jgi:hypothetical protein
VISLLVEGVLEQEQPEAIMIGFCFSFYCSADQRSLFCGPALDGRYANSPLKE